jgi:hypothetical protein
MLDFKLQHCRIISSWCREDGREMNMCCHKNGEQNEENQHHYHNATLVARVMNNSFCTLGAMGVMQMGE